METLFIFWVLLQLVGFGIYFYVWLDLRNNDDINDNNVYIICMFSVYYYIFKRLENINKTGKIILCILWTLLWFGVQLLEILTLLITLFIGLLIGLFCMIFGKKGE